MALPSQFLNGLREAVGAEHVLTAAYFHVAQSLHEQQQERAEGDQQRARQNAACTQAPGPDGICRGRAT